MVDATEGCVVVVGTEAGVASSLISSWHPPCPVVVVSADDSVLRKTNAKFSLYPCKVDALGTAEDVANAGAAVLFSFSFCGMRLRIAMHDECACRLHFPL